MRKTNRSIFVFSLLFFAVGISLPARAAWVWSPEAGKFINPDETVQETPQKQFDYAQDFYKKKDLKEAADQFRILIKRYPGSQVAPESQFRLGTIYEELGDYYRAFRAYRDLLTRYPQSDRVAEAVEREYRIGNLFLSGQKGKVMGVAILSAGPRAVEVFKHIVDAAPFSDYGDKARFQLGLAYKKTNQFEEAIQTFQGLIDQHPQSTLIPQARYQIADTSYLQSVVATRDQRVMDRAAEEIERFLTRYPNSTVSEKATRLRQEIDEKNAEKNYRVALFYEKENYLDSAFIYYRDVSARYSHTSWGKKAAERLQALEKPAEFLKSQENVAASQKQKLRDQLKAEGSNPAKKKELEWQIKQTEKQEKELRKSKPETLKRRKSALELKEQNLREKWKALKKKKKFFSKNLSPDLEAAFKRWEASLQKEQSDLEREQMQIKEWGRSLGVKTTPFYNELIPFGKDAPSPLEQLHQVEAKRFREIASKQTKILREKEKLYREYEKFLNFKSTTSLQNPAHDEVREKLEKEVVEMEELDRQLQEKEALYQKNYGTPSWQAVLRVPGKVIERSARRLNPFEGNARKDWESKSPEELKVLHKQWQEKITEQKKLAETISHAFDNELERAEENRLTSKIEEPQNVSSLRHAIKQLEREIRGRYNEIQDRNDKKNALLEELEQTLHGKKHKGALSQIAAPVRGAYGAGKAFIFGLPDRGVTITNEAKQVSPKEENQAVIRSLKEAIELESILIEARNREIEQFKRELEALRAQASLEKTQPARPLLVKIPYVFVREAVVSANKLVPRKDQHEKLIEQLNKETAILEQMKKDLTNLEIVLQEKGSKAPAERQSLPQTPAVPVPDQKTLQDEIHALEKRLELLRADYERQREGYEKIRWNKIFSGRPKVRPKKLRAVEKDLTSLIEDERKIHEEEKLLLFKKKALLQQLAAGPTAEIFSKELSAAKQQIDVRLHKIEKQKIASDQELKRLQPPVHPVS